MRPFLLVNAGSGGGQVQGDVLAAAAQFGLDHHVASPGDDFAAVLASAVAAGADILVAAGGDGTLCAVADTAMAHDLPMVVVPAGTRNHFALDLGLDLADPVGVLTNALSGGFERRVDVGTINGSTFLNNVSLGVYAVAVGSEAYRDNRLGALIDATWQAWTPGAGGEAVLSLSLPGTATIEESHTTAAVVVANNGYAPTFAPGNRLRPRLDGGEIWVYVAGGLQPEASALAKLAHLVGSALTQSVLRAAAGVTAIRIDADHPAVPVAVDGEQRPDLVPPFDLASRSRGLRLLVPSDPGPRPVEVALSW